MAQDPELHSITTRTLSTFNFPWALKTRILGKVKDFGQWRFLLFECLHLLFSHFRSFHSGISGDYECHKVSPRKLSILELMIYLSSSFLGLECGTVIGRHLKANLTLRFQLFYCLFRCSRVYQICSCLRTAQFQFQAPHLKVWDLNVLRIENLGCLNLRFQGFKFYLCSLISSLTWPLFLKILFVSVIRWFGSTVKNLKFLTPKQRRSFFQAHLI